MVKRAAIILLMVSLIIVPNVFSRDSEPTTVRPPAVAGMFYPADSSQLRQLVSDQLAAVQELPEIDGRIIAIIVPHAGLVYSGPIAAYSYKALQGHDIREVILCGPSHKYRFKGLSVYGPGVAWKTPLGTVVSDNKLCDKMIAYDRNIKVVPEAQTQEHSLEVQLPFLQTVLDSFTIVPIVAGSQDKAGTKLLANALSSLAPDEHTVMIASSDWQHYRPASVGGHMDSLGMKCLQELDPDRLQRYLAEGRVEACGGGPVVAVLEAAIAKGADRVKILKYGDSGDAFGDKSQVVGYLAAVIYKSNTTDAGNESSVRGSKMTEMEAEQMGMFSLTDSEKKELLTIARQSIVGYLAEGKLPEFTVPENLQEPGAAFVTLTKGGHLRGCIGHTVAGMPLYQTVASCAVSAALRDPRFPPIREDEVDSLHIEISVLTPLQEVKSLNDIQVGRDGLMVVKGHYSGLLLPQVASDYGWDKTRFLEHTCQKAGLPKEAYKFSGTTIYRFQALIFEEQH